MGVKIQFNLALEFICSMLRYEKNDQVSKKISAYRLQNSEEIQSWVLDVDQKMSPFLKADIDLLFIRFLPNFEVAAKTIIDHNIQRPAEFLSFFNAMSAEEYRNLCFSGSSLMQSDLNFHMDSSDEEIFKAASFAMDKSCAKILLLLKKDPLSIKKKTYETLLSFYKSFFREYEEVFYHHGMSLCEEHNRQFSNNADEFYQLFEFVDFKPAIDHNKELLFYISYTYQLICTYFVNADYEVLVYGFALINRLNDKALEKKSREFIKILADDKRYEILKLLGERKWYSSELANHFSLTPATMSYHINKLIEIGIISFESGEQNRIFYKLNFDRIETLLSYAARDLLNK